MSCVRAADPATLFRPGGRTIGDLARAQPVPSWVPDDMRDAYQLTSLFDGEPSAATLARQELGRRRGLRNFGENSARVALGPYSASSPACMHFTSGSGA